MPLVHYLCFVSIHLGRKFAPFMVGTDMSTIQFIHCTKSRVFHLGSTFQQCKCKKKKNIDFFNSMMLCTRYKN